MIIIFVNYIASNRKIMYKESNFNSSAFREFLELNIKVKLLIRVEKRLAEKVFECGYKSLNNVEKKKLVDKIIMSFNPIFNSKYEGVIDWVAMVTALKIQTKNKHF